MIEFLEFSMNKSNLLPAEHRRTLMPSLSRVAVVDMSRHPLLAVGLDIWILLKCLTWIGQRASDMDDVADANRIRGIIEAIRTDKQRNKVYRFFKSKTCHIEVALPKLEGNELKSQHLWFCKPVECDFLTQDRQDEVSYCWLDFCFHNADSRDTATQQRTRLVTVPLPPLYPCRFLFLPA
jgi:hypothetical protein